MKSPFPGMDPYLEMHWLDVHQGLCTYARDQIQTQLRGELVARMGERLVVETTQSERTRKISPDVYVAESRRDSGTVAVLEEPIVAAEPALFEVEDEELRQPFVEIQDARSGKVITVIEFLSPTNKLPGDGRRKYRQKRKEIHRSHVSLVEIDLAREGQREFLPKPQQTSERAQGTYQACVFRGYRRGLLEVYGFPLAQRLPAIRIPLRKTDKDVLLNLQALVDLAYEKGRYDLIDYAKPSVPPLEGDELKWAEPLLLRPVDKQA